MKCFTLFNLCLVWIMLMVIAGNGFAAEKVDSNSILADHEEWKTVYKDFEVDEALIEAMSYKIGENLRIDVYLGFWCGDSKNNVPPFLKIIDGIERYNVKIQLNYYSVERKPTKETKYYVEECKVERVPSFIFYRDGKEIGRIIENPKKSMIEDMMDILF